MYAEKSDKVNINIEEKKIVFNRHHAMGKVYTVRKKIKHPTAAQSCVFDIIQINYNASSAAYVYKFLISQNLIAYVAHQHVVCM